MLKTLSKCIRQYKKYAILTPLFVALEVLLEVIIPRIMSYLIDYGIDDGNMPYILKAGLVLFFSAVMSLVSGVLAGRTAAQGSCGFAANLRHDMYANIQDFSFSNIDKFSTSSLITRLTTDVTNVQMAYQMIIRLAFRCPIMLIMASVMSFMIDIDLSLIFIAFVPFLGTGLVLIALKAHPRFVRVFNTYDKLNESVQENLHGIRVVKSFDREDYEIDKFKKVSDSIYKDFSKAEKTVAFNMPLMQLCIYSCMLLISWFGARAVVACGGDQQIGLSTGELMSLIMYSMQILSSLMAFSMVFVMVIISRASARRIYEVLVEKSDITSPETGAVSEVKDGSIDFDNVTFYYSKSADKPVLDNINLHIKSGSTIGIVGGTGSSKSSLVQLIPRLYDVPEGSVKVGGIDVRNYDLVTLRDNVAMVLQKNTLFSGTIKENLRWGNENASDEEIKRACSLACADGFIESFPDKYDTYIEQGGTNVSGGQRQRLCIARALLKNPRILILDDSTSAVDTATDAHIRHAFKNEIPNTTKIIIAQRIASVKDADMIIVMDDGKICEAGDHDSLIKLGGIYCEMYTSQTKGGSDDE